VRVRGTRSEGEENNREVEDDPPDSSSPEGGPENGKREIPEHLINLFDSTFSLIGPLLLLQTLMGYA
jgi:hypothetical protein